MTTSSNASTQAHTSDAAFRAWATELDGYFLAIGFVDPGDTGQLNLATATRPATNTNAGVRIYKTNDGLVDIYLRVGYGTSYSATAVRVELTIGTTTDGAGNLGGAVIGPFLNTSAAVSAGPKSNYGCGVTGCYWIAYQSGGVGGAYPFFAFKLSRFCDSTGTPNSDGFTWYGWAASTRTTQQVTLQPTPSIQSAGLNVCLLPSSITSAVIPTGRQFWKHYTARPEMTVNPFVMTCDNGATPKDAQTTMTVAGTARNYINPGLDSFNGFGVGSTTNGIHALMLVWE